MARPRLNRAVVLERRTRQPDGLGGTRATWASVGTLWADVVAGRGVLAAWEGQTVTRVPYRITVRGLPEGHVARPRAGDRFRTGPRRWRVDAVAETDAYGAYLTCHAVEETMI